MQYQLDQIVNTARGRGKIVDNGGGIYKVQFLDQAAITCDGAYLDHWNTPMSATPHTPLETQGVDP